VDEAAEPVVSVDRCGWRCPDGRCWRAGFGWCEAERAVWPVAVVVVDELVENVLQVSAVGDQHPVEALSSDRSDESLRYRVGDRRQLHLMRVGCQYSIVPVGVGVSAS
jgi:hypothetical protein